MCRKGRTVPLYDTLTHYTQKRDLHWQVPRELFINAIIEGHFAVVGLLGRAWLGMLGQGWIVLFAR